MSARTNYDRLTYLRDCGGCGGCGGVLRGVCGHFDKILGLPTGDVVGVLLLWTKSWVKSGLFTPSLLTVKSFRDFC